PERRRHRPRPPARLLRCPYHRHPAERDGVERRPARPCDHVYWSGPGYRDHYRARVTPKGRLLRAPCQFSGPASQGTDWENESPATSRAFLSASISASRIDSKIFSQRRPMYLERFLMPCVHRQFFQRASPGITRPLHHFLQVRFNRAPGNAYFLRPALKVLITNRTPRFSSTQVQRRTRLILHIYACGNDVIGRRQQRRHLVRIKQAPVLEMSIPVPQQNIDQQ